MAAHSLSCGQARAYTFSWAAKIWALERVEKTSFINQLRIFGFLEAWLTPDGLYRTILFLFFIVLLHFKTSPHLLQVFRRMLPCCFAMKLQKCFMDYNFWMNLSFKSLFCLFDSSMMILNEVVSVFRSIQDEQWNVLTKLQSVQFIRCGCEHTKDDDMESVFTSFINLRRKKSISKDTAKPLNSSTYIFSRPVKFATK